MLNQSETNKKPLLAATEKPLAIKTNSTELEDISLPASTQHPEDSDSLINSLHLIQQATFNEVANSFSRKVK